MSKTHDEHLENILETHPIIEFYADPGEIAHRRVLGEWLATTVERLISLSSDETKARQLWEMHAQRQLTAWAKLRTLRNLLGAGGLATWKDLDQVSIEPPKDTEGRGYSHKALHVMR